MSKYIKGKLFFLLLIPALVLVFPAVTMAQVHTVSRGDTIYKISNWYGVDQFALRYTNNLWSDQITPGQKIVIPFKYTVQKGDTLYLIGKKFGVDYSRIRQANRLGSNVIYPGQVLYIPSNSRTGGYVPVSRGGGISAYDFDLLARIITAEADSESYETQVAVGAVVLNRVDSPLFPNTIRGVVYQVDETGRYQFEPVLNGWINNPASESGRRAAMDALNGWDPTNGALYFFESWVPNKFLQSRPVSRILDSFTFTW
ncbi:LysM peptidoglycan-binding domain-containing protein [Desulfallas sp. Bu1-1]|uniref:LysM peptidoglycan-binding domain-containing protein n=1 Tax=Desulfallas sp. Bu1-1 TaxID=2787620 RepID=UPI00189D9F55|nr:LysM peptidoglycan-binding domain-containing protein [Desulfallas sp. Bu1-1]MBF7081999.1 LysM peptidoglycan-binding domain-containing protein [Desulfallas sp. Bu1-1]